MADYKKLGDKDLYKLIGVEFTATEGEVSQSSFDWENQMFTFNFVVDQKIVSQESSRMPSR